MSIYVLMLFVHVVADLLIFIGLGLELVSVAGLRRSRTVEQAQALVPLLPLANLLGIVGGALILVSGLYMALTVWDLRQGWLATALVSLFLLMGPTIGAIIEPRTKAIAQAITTAEPGPLPAAVRARLHDPLLATALQTDAGIVLGIVFLMTVKPALAGAIISMAVFVALGAASGWPYWRAARRDRSS